MEENQDRQPIPDLQTDDTKAEEINPEENFTKETVADLPIQKTALTIHIHSWATPIIGIIMLIIGLVGGYLIKGVVTPKMPVVVNSPQVAETSSPNTTAEPQAQAANAKAMMTSVVSRTRHFKGDEKAPVTIIEFADFQCPYCGRFATGPETQINDAYIKTGKVRLGYQHFAFLGQESQWAAEASECASDQQAFWNYYDKLFRSQQGENQGAFNKENLKKFAADLKLDTKAFNDCLDSGKYTAIVQSETKAAQELGVQSTPSFLVNGQPVVGAQPFETFQKYIDAAVVK